MDAQIFDELNNSQAPEELLLDDLFRATVEYRGSKAYLDLLNYIARFRRYAPYNCFLLRVQRPDVGYVATPSDWWREFGRRVLRDARPLVMLRPFGPVMFVFDVAGTDGRPVPEGLLDPFNAQGNLHPTVWDQTVASCREEEIEMVRLSFSKTHAGLARAVMDTAPNALPRYEVVVNAKQNPAQAYVTLTHELAHIFLGHLGGHPRRRWPDRPSLSTEQKEFEAESVSYLVCARQGLMTTAPEYLASYLGAHQQIPSINVHLVIAVASKLWDMGRRIPKGRNWGTGY